ncbi:glutathione S-transferase [Kordiimonas sediminis]|uniref:Glutathione S-transferase n=2 Tax=Kordiimonas sediminis TaxID=1735581 RepID=A0A919AJC4_9PROT|nr:glutathione S-transferase [Kordiimonas sediminis]
MSETELPILYSFRRCPYAMRARMALLCAGIRVKLREVRLKEKPLEMLEISPKGSVPVLQLPDGQVIDESLEIMIFAADTCDSQNELDVHRCFSEDHFNLIRDNDSMFVHHLNRYKYASWHDGADPMEHRDSAQMYLQGLENILMSQPYLAGDRMGFVDVAIAPFVRQFSMPEPKWFVEMPQQRVVAWLNDFVTSELFATAMVKYDQWTPDSPVEYFPKDQ